MQMALGNPIRNFNFPMLHIDFWTSRHFTLS